MTFRGTIQNGRVVPDNALTLPDGTRVEISRLTPAARSKTTVRKSATPRLMLSELARDLSVADLSLDHDHYASGAPRRAPARQKRVRK
ncbi:MAG TPA: hypothetical protein VK157_06305 [Phycisphaerales bacterium]|nr:hypothetical protein [Phycisphaerales bacterium]